MWPQSPGFRLRSSLQDGQQHRQKIHAGTWRGWGPLLTDSKGVNGHIGGPAMVLLYVWGFTSFIQKRKGFVV